MRHRPAVLVAVQTPTSSDRDCQRSLHELAELARGLGYTPHAELVQRRAAPAPTTYLGAGKLTELATLVREHPDSVVIVDDELTPGQQRALTNALEVDILDRAAVILHVFEARAHTRMARLEVELARLEYELPRIRDDHSLGDREGGGGRASRGHSNVELAKMRARDRIAEVRRQLAQLATGAERQRQARAEQQRVALVGYTNAGKSSLMRLLTDSDVLIKDQLFATLGTTVRPIVPPLAPPVLVVDTVGFIDRLPHTLVASFRSTLAEAHDAQLLLHVVDAADPAWRDQARVTSRVLDEIGAGGIPSWLVLNKIDRVSASERDALAEEVPDALQTNAFDPAHATMLRQRIANFFAARLAQETFAIAYAQQGAVAALRGRMQVVREEYGEHVELTVRAPPDVLHELRKLALP